MTVVLTGENTPRTLFDTMEEAWAHVNELLTAPIEIDPVSPVQHLPSRGGTFVVQPLEDLYDEEGPIAQRVGDTLVHRDAEGILAYEDYTPERMRELNVTVMTEEDAYGLFDAELNLDTEFGYLARSGSWFSPVAMLMMIEPVTYKAMFRFFLTDNNIEIYDGGTDLVVTE